MAPSRSARERLRWLCPVLLVAAISVWFLGVRSALWWDETISFWQIHKGFTAISSRQQGQLSAYPYILWLCSKVFGTRELALRIPSIAAMSAAVWFLWRGAREIFDRDVAYFVAAIFCLHPIVSFAAIDVRPYAFAALAVAAAIFLLLHWRNDDSLTRAALFGVVAGGIGYFHLLFLTILPALALGFALLRAGQGRSWVRPFCVAAATCAATVMPLTLALLFMAHTSGEHVVDKPPQLLDLLSTMTLWGFLALMVGGAILAAMVTKKLLPGGRPSRRIAMVCLALGVVPLLTLFAFSALTPIHVFLPRYRLVGLAGIALSWGLALQMVRARAIRLVTCVLTVGLVVGFYFSMPSFKQHKRSWKYAIEIVQAHDAQGDVKVLMCSGLIESNFSKMPDPAEVKENAYFTPLAYYPIAAPVTGLPLGLNEEAQRIGADFLRTPASHHFFAMGDIQSYPTLDWLQQQTANTHIVKELGEPQGIKVLEFVAREEGK